MKDGDILLDKLRQATKRRNDIALFAFAPLYQPPWWYWIDYLHGNNN